MIIVASSDPFNLDPFDDLRVMLGAQPVYTPEEVFGGAIHECYNKDPNSASQEIQEFKRFQGRIGRLRGGNIRLAGRSTHKLPLLKS